jgi:hypothetical protein
MSLSSQNIKQRSQTYKLASICEGCCFHVEIPCKTVQFSRIFLKMQGYLWIIRVKIGRSLMDNLGKKWQLINILFCGYRRRLEIHYWRLEIASPLKMNAETYTRQGTGCPCE